MPKNDELATKTGPEKTDKEAVCAYDNEHGHYEPNITEGSTVADRPAKDTKSPFGGLSGGK